MAGLVRRVENQYPKKIYLRKIPSLTIVWERPSKIPPKQKIENDPVPITKKIRQTRAQTTFVLKKLEDSFDINFTDSESYKHISTSDLIDIWMILRRVRSRQKHQNEKIRIMRETFFQKLVERSKVQKYDKKLFRESNDYSFIGIVEVRPRTIHILWMIKNKLLYIIQKFNPRDKKYSKEELADHVIPPTNFIYTRLKNR
jgi:hypothetical protein